MSNTAGSGPYIMASFCVSNAEPGNKYITVKLSVCRPGDSRFQDVEAPRFPDSRHMKLVRLSQPYASAAFTPHEIFLVLISVRG